MDVLRKELDLIYASQCLYIERLDPLVVADAKLKAEIMAETGSGCTVVTDASCDRCYIYAKDFGALMGLSDELRLHREVDSSDEDEIYIRMHPEDLVEKRMLEYELFKSVDSMAPECKTDCKATCRIRMKDREGKYIVIDNSTQVINLSPAGKMWLILCCYNLSPDQTIGHDISPRIVNCRTGDIRTLSFGDKRKHILTNREKEILQLIQAGKASKMIADILGISIHTVNRHRQNIIEKLSVGNSIEAIAAATAMRLL